VNQNFKQNYSLDSDMHLISCFISAIQSFSIELTGSTMKTINFENFTFHFSKDSNNPDILYVFVTNNDHDPKDLNCKIHRIASVFINEYGTKLNTFKGEITPFNRFADTLIEMKIAEKNCGDYQNCIMCPFNTKKSQIMIESKENKKILIQLLDNLLIYSLNEVPDLLAALLIDFNGFIITRQSVKGFNEEMIESILSMVEPNIQKIKSSTETSFGSGTFNFNEYQFFFLELGIPIPVLFLIVADSYSNIDQLIPYFYMIAEKITLILSKRSNSIFIPKLINGGGLEINPQEDSNTKKNLVNQIFIIGAERTGKSSLIEKYINGKFIKDYKPTIGLSIVKKNFHISKENKIAFYLFDMGGLKSFAKVRKSYYKITKANAVLIFFDYTRMDTLEKINEWLEESLFFIEDNSLFYFLVGNKIDLIKNRNEIRLKAELIAKKHNCLLFETSALTGEGIDEMFMYIAMNC